MTNLDFLQRIDWFDHDGVNLPMINDVIRNQFYDKMLESCVVDSNCVDIGFGTGLLSILALKHGAKHVLAFESDPDRYKLGQLIIDRLNLNDRIALLNQRYENTMFDQFSDIDVLFTETMTTNLWGEGLLSNLPRNPGIRFLPENISVNIYAYTVPDRFAQLIKFAANEVDGFDPGVDVDIEFIKLINELGFPGYVTPQSEAIQGLISFNCHEKKHWGWLSHLKLLSIDSKIVASYTLNTKDVTFVRNDARGFSVSNIDYTATQEKLIIDTKNWQKENLLLVPRVRLTHGHLTMTLDDGCWGPIDPIIAVKPHSNIVFEHNLLNGNINYIYE